MNDVITTISPARPERISLDFERLRAEGIRRLEDWAPFIWTDFNAHDPGITILEVLCYAITDLAYRTRLPIEDLLASGPSSLHTKAFFTAEEILPTCPVTENDFRKIIIDIPGVKNAWLEKAGLQTPRVCIHKEWVTRPISPALVERLESLFDENNRPDDLTEFEQTLIDIGDSETIPEESKDQLGNIFRRFMRDTTSITPEDIAFIRQTAEAQTEEVDAENLHLLADRMELFMSFYRCTEKYHLVAFRCTDTSTIAALKAIIEDLSSAQLKKSLALILKKLAPNTEPDFGMQDLVQLWKYVDELALNQPDDARLVFKLANEIICKLAYYKLMLLDEGENPPEDCEIIYYNGLYKVKLDLHDPSIEPGTKASKRIIRAVLDKLHQNRNLCEDFAEICLVETQYLCLCLDIEIQPEADENEVMAEVMFQLQEFLTPTIRFYSLQQMLERGLTGDQILNGPLLDHGFIPDDELERGVIPEKIFISDLYHVILDVEGVLNINELAIKKAGDKEYVSDLTCLHLHGKKPVIDVCCSWLYTTREGFTIRILEKDITDIIELKQLEIRNLVGNPKDKLPVPKGNFREDLAEFTSIQIEFPQNYALGFNGPPPDATPLQMAQIKQLQAYLTFYDRMMADYLQQLSHVKNLFTVEQDPAQATYFYDALYHISGIKELIFQPVSIGDNQIKSLRKKLAPEVISLLESSDLIGKSFTAFGEWNLAMEEILGHYWTESSYVRTTIAQEIIQDYTEKEWQDFMEDDENYYVQKLQEIIEPATQQRQRRNQILNHMLARFGEQFTHFSLQQFGVSQEVSLYENYLDYLKAKADFLKNIPAVSSKRAKAYNYRKFIYGADGSSDSEITEGKIPVRPDVWNTDNVAGLKKKIYHLLNMGPATTESIFCDPKYRIDLDEDENAERPRYFIQLVELDEDNLVQQILLTSTRAYSRNQARLRQQKLNENISRQDWLKVVQSDVDSGSYRVQFSFEDGSDTTILQSGELNRKQAENLQEKIIEMIDPEACNKEGFHLIEHILLRPMVKDDALLKHSYTCDLQMEPLDPYSFWLTLVLPGWTQRFRDIAYRKYFEQLVRRETPAHIALCFRWLEDDDKITMKQLEDALEHWREAKADCEPDACDVSDQAERLLDILNCFPCACYCKADEKPETLCGCDDEPEKEPVRDKPIYHPKK